MILGNLNNVEQYKKVSPLFKEAFEYLETLDLDDLKIGKTEIKGKDLFINITNTTLKTKENAKVEIHNLYADIQIPISKSETYGWIDRSKLQTEKDVFNVEKDIQFFEDKATTFVSIQPQDFVIFFPEDGHAPGIGEGEILKIVVKIKVK